MSAALRGALCSVFLCIVTAPGCARRQHSESQQTLVPVALTVRNNLNTPLNLTVAWSDAVLWTQRVSAKDSIEAVFGPVPEFSKISLRASDLRGTIVSSRDNISVGRRPLIWTIP